MRNRMQVAVLKKLRAENVVRFLGVCGSEQHTMLVTEFMEGGDLYRALESGCPTQRAVLVQDVSATD